MEVSGYHHNVLGGFLSLRPGIFCTGTGSVELRGFLYKGL
jgi:xylan 1,4-beta-xylosidase